MSWANSKCVTLDVESTGVNVESDRIVSAHAAIVDSTGVAYQRDWLIAVDIDIPTAASDIHGITTDQARQHGRPAAEVVREFAGAVRFALKAGMPIVGYNVSYDLSILDRECSRWLGQDLAATCGGQPFPVIDPYVIWKHVEPYRKGNRKLTTACEAFGVQLDNAHTAAADAIAAARVAMALGKRFPQISTMTAAELHVAQVGWRREQCDGLRAYFDSRGTEHDGVPGDWPLIPQAATVQPSLAGAS